MMSYRDSLEMKLQFIYELMRSIHLDFSKNSALEERKDLALKFTTLAIKELNRRISVIKKSKKKSLPLYGTVSDNREMISQLKILKKTIAHFTPYKQDGRYFRDEFPYGYYNMMIHLGIK